MMGERAASTKCRECNEGPRGIAGHDSLALAAKEKPDDAVLFRCAVCSFAWIRSYEGSGTFIWTPFEQPKRA